MPLVLAARRPAVDLVCLTVLCLVVFALLPTSHGLMNWQESVRALAAGEMHRAGDWLTPRVAGEPYLAKPPMIYWTQLMLHRLIGPADGGPGEVHLRLAVALWGWLGVLATYLAARDMLRFGTGPAPGPRASVAVGDEAPDRAWRDDAERAAFADHAAWWSALFLATGVLYVRSSRIGELDILTAAPTVVGVWAIFRAWRAHAEVGRTSVRAVAAACGCSALLALIKGPPAMLPMLLGGFGGIVLHGAMARVGDRGPGVPLWVRAIVGVVLCGLILLSARSRIATVGDAVGVSIVAVAWGLVAGMLAGLLDRSRVAGCWIAMSRTHPVGVALAGLAALAGWAKLVQLRSEVRVAGAAAREAGDNLNILVAESPLRVLEASAYAVGVGSVAAVVAMVWLIKDRPRWQPAWWLIAAWAGLTLAALATLGKGPARYLTPAWPAIAMLGGLWAAAGVRNLPFGRLLARGMGAAVVVLALGQAWWYADGRERYFADRSPRDLMSRVMPLVEAGEPLAAVDFWEPALDVYAGRHVTPVLHHAAAVDFPHRATPLSEWLERLRTSGSSGVVLVRRRPPPEGSGWWTRAGEWPDPVGSLELAGVAVEPLDAGEGYKIDKARTPVIALRVRPN